MIFNEENFVNNNKNESIKELLIIDKKMKNKSGYDKDGEIKNKNNKLTQNNIENVK